jgi:hypothetical protein
LLHCPEIVLPPLLGLEEQASGPGQVLLQPLFRQRALPQVLHGRDQDEKDRQNEEKFALEGLHRAGRDWGEPQFISS